MLDGDEGASGGTEAANRSRNQRVAIRHTGGDHYVELIEARSGEASKHYLRRKTSDADGWWGGQRRRCRHDLSVDNGRSGYAKSVSIQHDCLPGRGGGGGGGGG